MSEPTEPLDPPAASMEELGEAECIQLIESTPIGRLGFISDGTPLVLPVNYAWHEGGVVFRTLEGQKMAAAAAEQHVCFEVDDWNPDDRTGWSVVITGVATEVKDWAETETLERLGLVPWAKGEWRVLWVRVHPHEISGRRLT